MSRVFAGLLVFAALLGLIASSYSTMDFVQHLDRQVHSIHCSFVPGLTDPTVDAASGCHVALMSTWSSVFRSAVWGGLPVALPGIAIFAFLMFRGIEFWAARGLRDRQAAVFILVTTLIPVFTSIFFGTVAITQLETFCQTCAAIYASSALALVAAIGLVATTWNAAETEPESAATPYLVEHPAMTWGIGLAELGLFVGVPVVAYFLMAPDHSKYVGACGTLPNGEDTNKVLVPIGHGGQRAGAKSAIEVFDPLCPACRGFEQRLSASGLAAQLDRKALLFPLDSKCNWMITSDIHPGACVVSEAILCANDRAQAVIDWAFEHQEEVREAAKADGDAAKRMILASFPELEGCIGSANAKQRLNRSLRWAVQNRLPVLTPQLYVEGKKLCDEDTDLGLDYALSRLIALEGT